MLALGPTKRSRVTARERSGKRHSRLARLVRQSRRGTRAGVAPCCSRRLYGVTGGVRCVDEERAGAVVSMLSSDDTRQDRNVGLRKVGGNT